MPVGLSQICPSSPSLFLRNWAAHTNTHNTTQADCNSANRRTAAWLQLFERHPVSLARVAAVHGALDASRCRGRSRWDGMKRASRGTDVTAEKLAPICSHRSSTRRGNIDGLQSGKCRSSVRPHSVTWHVRTCLYVSLCDTRSCTHLSNQLVEY